MYVAHERPALRRSLLKYSSTTVLTYTARNFALRQPQYYGYKVKLTLDRRMGEIISLEVFRKFMSWNRSILLLFARRAAGIYFNA